MCVKCLSKLPHKYIYFGPHIKEICGNCGFYVKFTKKTEIPSVADSKSLIWEMTNDLKLINDYKLKMSIFDKEGSLSYHNLYVEILKHYFGNEF